jgi:transposase
MLKALGDKMEKRPQQHGVAGKAWPLAQRKASRGRSHYESVREPILRVTPLTSGGWKMTGSLADEIRKMREQANILAEEARVLEENSNERARKAGERLQRLLQENR